ncbi:MAG: TetR/AcrR family transcriptional regulator [Nigerium sp.]|nr:TetR/AcrR family transcriptional regulator [Nigerium sp.]
MSRTSGRANRGPAAADENRRAILLAARELLTEQGGRVPLSAIAQRAGVSQGVLYRHFRGRLDLAYAAFEDNFRTLEALAAQVGPGRFRVLWDTLVVVTLASTAFIELVVAERASGLPDDISVERLVDALTAPLREAQRDEEVPASWTPADLVLVLNMVHGVAVSRPGDLDAVRRALGLVDPSLVPADLSEAALQAARTAST